MWKFLANFYHKYLHLKYTWPGNDTAWFGSQKTQNWLDNKAGIFPPRGVVEFSTYSIHSIPISEVIHHFNLYGSSDRLRELIIAPEEWAPGMWAGMENSAIKTDKGSAVIIRRIYFNERSLLVELFHGDVWAGDKLIIKQTLIDGR